ncbi:hypothetical protein AB0I72_11370 [Nocardiopsis sp. NPDC049922]|uniref:hypothetical protein n=1 Tax=Nocardiopsis sp. NPDC049922 TaxID=3155157 RepID=UPI00340FE085
MDPMTVGDLRQFLNGTADDTPITDALGHALVDVDVDDPTQVALLFSRPAPRPRTVVNTVTGDTTGGLIIQTSGDLHGSIRL